MHYVCMLQLTGAPSKPTVANHIQLPLTFTKEEDMESAFSRLSISVVRAIRTSNFIDLQLAAMDKAKSLRFPKSHELLPQIDEVTTFEKLCVMLRKSTYWSFLDTRIMEALVTASMIPTVQQSVENYKKTYFAMSLEKVAPYFPIDIQVKPGYTAVEEVLSSDPKKMTVHQLHKHRFYLETELFQTGSGTCSICKIVIGSVKITWQISVGFVFQVSTLLLSKKYDLETITHLSIPEVEMWKGLPILWRGQEVGKIGSIETLLDPVRREPYPLPTELKWLFLGYDSFLKIHFNVMLLREHAHWTLLHPHNKSRSLLTIEKAFSSMMVMMTCRVPLHIRIVDEVFPLIYLQYAWVHQDFTHFYSLHNTLIKEVMRRGNLERIYHALFINAVKQIIRPIVIFTIWSYHFYLTNPPLPYSTTRVATLRKMVEGDISKAFTLTNKYVLQFKIGQVFQTEEEFSHYFLTCVHQCLVMYVHM